MAGGHQFLAAVATLIRKNEHYKFNKTCQAPYFGTPQIKLIREISSPGRKAHSLRQKAFRRRGRDEFAEAEPIRRARSSLDKG
jgi:hypothetical protein